MSPSSQSAERHRTLPDLGGLLDGSANQECQTPQPPLLANQITPPTKTATVVAAPAVSRALPDQGCRRANRSPRRRQCRAAMARCHQWRGSGRASPPKWSAGPRRDDAAEDGRLTTQRPGHHGGHRHLQLRPGEPSKNAWAKTFKPTGWHSKQRNPAFSHRQRRWAIAQVAHVADPVD
jgi:hypothetical protein